MNYDTLPEGFQCIRTVDLNTKQLKVWLNMAALPVLAAFAVPMLFAVPLKTQMPFHFDLAAESPGRYFLQSMAYLVLLMAGSIGYLLLHEWIHGLCFRYVAGGKPNYGHKLPFFLYAACENRYICKRQYYVISLAPFMVITVLCAVLCAVVPQSWFWVPYFVLASNASGCTGDAYVSCLLARMPKDILVIDSGTAMQVFSREATE